MKENDSLFGSSGKRLFSYDGLIGHGYNVLTSPFYQSEYVKQCVLKMDDLAADGYVYEDLKSQRSVEFVMVSGETLSSYYNNLAFNAGVNVKSLFSGSLSVDFNISSKVDEKKSFAKGSSILTKSKQYVNMSDIGKTNLREKYLTEYFKESCLLNPKIPPKELFEKFGTHIMLTVYLGGRLDMSYVYNNVNHEDNMSIGAKVEASYGIVSGSIDTDLQKKSRQLIENSTYKLRAYGGKVDIDMSTFDKAKANIGKWSESIENTDYLTLIKAGKLDNDFEMMPIWELVDETTHKARFNEIFDEYKRQLEAIGKTIDNLQKRYVPVYIKDIYMGAHKEDALAISDLKSKSRETIHVIHKDLNAGARGDFIYLGYTTTTNPNDALRAICIHQGGNPPVQDKKPQFQYASFTTLMQYDTNRGASGEFIYLCYSKEPKVGPPITGLFVECNGDLNGMDGTNWSRVIDGYTGQAIDLNKHTRHTGAYIYLWVQQ